MAVLPRPVTMIIFGMPEWMASSTPYWISGLSTSGSISLGIALVAGRKRVPSPAAGKTALRTFLVIPVPFYRQGVWGRVRTVPAHGLLQRYGYGAQLLADLIDEFRQVSGAVGDKQVALNLLALATRSGGRDQLW